MSPISMRLSKARVTPTMTTRARAITPPPSNFMAARFCPVFMTTGAWKRPRASKRRWPMRTLHRELARPGASRRASKRASRSTRHSVSSRARQNAIGDGVGFRWRRHHARANRNNPRHDGTKLKIASPAQAWIFASASAALASARVLRHSSRRMALCTGEISARDAGVLCERARGLIESASAGQTVCCEATALFERASAAIACRELGSFHLPQACPAPCPNTFFKSRGRTKPRANLRRSKRKWRAAPACRARSTGFSGANSN